MSYKEKEIASSKERRRKRKEYYEKNREKEIASSKERRRKHTEINQRIIDEGRWDEHIKELYPTGMKSCSTEKKERPINHFNRRITISKGLQPQCKGCNAYEGAKGRHKKRFSDQEMVSLEDFLEIFYAEKCYVCKIDNEHNTVDRKKSDKGYIKGNVATCCWKCNNMKGAMSLNEFIEHCRLIVENNPEPGVNVPNIKVKDRVEERKSHLVTIKFP